jgi:mycothiol synthase
MTGVERLDPVAATDAALAETYAVQVACRREVGGADLMRTAGEMAAWMRHPPGFQRRAYWVARRAGAVAGFAALSVPVGDGAGPVTARLNELAVVPEHRGRGLGRALLAAVRDEALAWGAGRLWGVFMVADGERFARAAGARTGNRTRHAALRLPAELPEPAPLAGYRLESWVAPTPAGLVASYARAREALNDAPHDHDAGTEHWTADKIRDLEAAVARRGQQTRVTVALDGAGEVVGYSELRVGPERGMVASTEDTAVVAAHRGRGLARRIKLESLRRLAADRPDVTAVVTDNDVTNAAMLAVNTALGFTEVAIQTDAFLPLA